MSPVKLADKRIEFFLKDGDSERIFTVQMKPKIFKKLTDHGFVDWVAAITGEIGPATVTGFELVNAAVQVFEKKAKAETDAVTEAKSDAVAQPPKSEGDAVVKDKAVAEPKGAGAKKKSLLDNVRIWTLD